VCRIAGILDKKSATVVADVQAMSDSMKHGGPDSDGVYYDETNKLAFGHRRLSIIDLSNAAQQPMASVDGSVVIVYNGEVYNYIELKKELQQQGVAFSTNSDTEVILNAYIQWGTESFSKLKGMFAFALHDKRSNELILARDPNGIKPLYYYIDDTSLYFASEIKAFKATGRKWVEQENWRIYFLTYGYLPEPITTLKNIKPIAKGTFLRINISTLSVKQEVFEPEYYSESITTEKEAIELIQKTLDKAVDRHLISDAPIGLFLSGGIDSSLLTLIAKKTGHNDLHTLSIIFGDKDYTEEEYQNIIVKATGAKHKAYSLTKEICIDAMPDILKAMDQPSADGVNSYFICKFARQAGLKAVLSGLGADELLGGYASFTRTELANKLRRIPSALLHSTSRLGKDKYRKVSFLSRKDAVGEYLFNRGFFSTRETASILGSYHREVEEVLETISVPEYVNQLHDGNKVSYLERNLYMQNQLLKDTDVMSMWHSVEVRVPFLDIDFVRAVNSIKPSLKYRKGKPKYLLVESYKDILPEAIWNRRKQGFVFPFQKWMEGNENLYTGSVDEKMTKKYKQGKINWSRYWTYIILQSYNTVH
jgi:asparagine synthase (glutamine-hydrolysing)